MKTFKQGQALIANILICFIACLSLMQAAFAASTDLANVPMAVKNAVTPNVAVIIDNSQSMDGLMGGALIPGNDPNTRGNIGRQSMRTAIDNYRLAFNWGLMSYEMSGTPTYYKTWLYLMGSDTGMVFTDDCVGYVVGTPATYPPTAGISASNGGRRCVANPQPFAPGGTYITYDVSSDDSTVVDALYDNGAYTTAWALTSGLSSSGYKFYGAHTVAAGNSWAAASFTGDPFGCGNCTLTFTATDAGYLPYNAPITRQLYTPRGWGYLASITGAGKINEAVQVDSTTHYNNLMSLLASETNSATGEIKNGALYTPLTGTLGSAKTYFSTTYQTKASPIAYTCQQNFVMLVTDGLPTGTTTGSLYSAADRTNTCVWNTTTNSCTSGSFGVAATAAINAVTALRTTANTFLSTRVDGSGSVTGKYDVQTYVVALASTLGNNAQNMSVMNAMAYAGGGLPTALLATDTATFENAMTTITDDVTAKTGSAAAVSVANAHVTSTDNASYVTSYNSGTWTGNLDAYAIDLTTGLPSTTSLWTSGSARDQLDAMAFSTRKIVTSPDAAGAIGGIQFQPTSASTTTKLSTAQQTLLNTPTLTDGAAVLSYLRGDPSGETSGTYRVRAHILGDTVNAEPAVVMAPSQNYADAGYQGTGSTFKEANASRTRMVYQGANDGMLHAIVAATGAEAWAYIPNLVMANLNNLSSKASFTHKYSVDGTPVSGDVDFKQTNGATGSGTDWRTILVSGLGKGGRGYYALDVTNPDVLNEAAVASKVLWEFPNSISNAAKRNAAKLNSGYSFGKPIIVKTKAEGWVVLVTSGYNNGINAGDSGGDGLGHLYVVNPRTGDLIQDITTPSCSATPTTTPCGLAQIAAYVDNYSLDNTTDFVYGGDLMGNVWRFDLTATGSSTSWSVSKFAVLKDASGVTQPVTTTPLLANISLSGTATRFVYIGTGQYLGDSDVPASASPNSHATQTQTMYGLTDDTTTTLPDPLRSSLQAQTLTISGSSSTVSSNTVNYPTKKGWYIDLPTTGERANTDPVLALGVLGFTTNIPSTTVCIPGGSSWVYFLDYKTGGVATGSTVASGSFLGNALASRVVLVQLPSGKVVSLVRMSDATTIASNVPTPTVGTGTSRISWREIFN
jgi:type IV pilus assembly protein PilY1